MTDQMIHQIVVRAHEAGMSLPQIVELLQDVEQCYRLRDYEERQIKDELVRGIL